MIDINGVTDISLVGWLEGFMTKGSPFVFLG
jgi:hypothetical protein